MSALRNRCGACLYYDPHIFEHRDYKQGQQANWGRCHGNPPAVFLVRPGTEARGYMKNNDERCIHPTVTEDNIACHLFEADPDKKKGRAK